MKGHYCERVKLFYDKISVQCTATTRSKTVSLFTFISQLTFNCIRPVKKVNTTPMLHFNLHILQFNCYIHSTTYLYPMPKSWAFLGVFILKLLNYSSHHRYTSDYMSATIFSCSKRVHWSIILCLLFRFWKVPNTKNNNILSELMCNSAIRVKNVIWTLEWENFSQNHCMSQWHKKSIPFFNIRISKRQRRRRRHCE